MSTQKTQLWLFHSDSTLITLQILHAGLLRFNQVNEDKVTINTWNCCNLPSQIFSGMKPLSDFSHVLHQAAKKKCVYIN